MLETEQLSHSFEVSHSRTSQTDTIVSVFSRKSFIATTMGMIEILFGEGDRYQYGPMCIPTLPWRKSKTKLNFYSKGMYDDLRVDIVVGLWFFANNALFSAQSTKFSRFHNHSLFEHVG